MPYCKPDDTKMQTTTYTMYVIHVVKWDKDNTCLERDIGRKRQKFFINDICRQTDITAMTPVCLALRRCLTAPHGPMQKAERGETSCQRQAETSLSSRVHNGHLPWVGVGSHYPAPVLLALYNNHRVIYKLLCQV